MISKAHLESSKWIIDPFYSAVEKLPRVQENPQKGCWLYYPYDREAFLLEKMFREKNEAKLKVGYTEFRRVPLREVFFYRRVSAGNVISFKASGSVQVSLNGGDLLDSPPSDFMHTIIAPSEGELKIRLFCEDIQTGIPALFVQEEPEKWKISSDGKNREEPVCQVPLSDGKAPHYAELPGEMLSGKKISENSWDAGRELFAYVHISCSEKILPSLYVGESLAEMENKNPEDEEQTRELVKIAPGKWKSKVLLAFRYVKVENAPDAEVAFEAEFMPLCYKGALFVPEKEDWNRIWLQSAYTLRLCMKNFLLDGIKRDRLPWAGDLAVSLLGNAFSFGEKEIVKDTLSVFGAVSIRKAHINKIIDYTLWYLINHQWFQLYYGDENFLRREYPRIRETLEILLEEREGSGFLKADIKKVWLFIDWVQGEKFTALQVIFYRALLAGAFLARQMGEKEFGSDLEQEAEKLRRKLKELAFDAEKGLFTSAPGKKEYTRHPNLLAVDFGLVEGEEARKIARELAGNSLPKVGTPYMSVFEVMAIFKGGYIQEAWAKLDGIWGGMLRAGATTFWEGFDPDHKGKEHYVFYDRPFGKSLCHAWGAGPAFLLPQLLFGIEPLSCSWETFRIAPLEGLTASVTVPTPYGNILAECADGKLVFLSAPKECKKV